MRWPWKRRHADEQALEEARHRLQQVREQWSHVEQAAERMRRHKRRNNFGPSIAQVYATRRKP